MFKLRDNCTHFTCQQHNAQNPSSQASTVCEMRTYRCTSQIQKRQRGTKDQIANILLDHRKKQENSRKTSTSASWTTRKPLCGSQQTVENSFRNRSTRSPYQSPEEPVRRSRSKLLTELDMEQQTGSKLGKEHKAKYCHSAYLIYMQRT